jgi:RNA polymerase sigma factor (sigma-70 family)
VADGADVAPAVEAVWRIEAPHLVASLARVVRDIGVAEDLAQDAFVAALQQWPESGVPDNPGAWLMATARHRAIDHIRRRDLQARKQEALAVDVALQLALAHDDHDAGAGGRLDEDLALLFTCCHPCLPADQQTALTLRLFGGLTTTEIARAYLMQEAAMGQRIWRAKRTLREAGIPIEVPEGGELQPRLAAVLQVVYLIFTEGYAPTEGDAWTRPELCEEALRLGRRLQALVPADPEVQSLAALMELHASRLRARRGPGGRAVLLADQDRDRWDPLLLRRGLAALERAEAVAGGPAGPYRLQAEIAACHARAGTIEDTDWLRIAALYALLARIAPSPVVELNRAVAIGRAIGPEAGLALVAGLDEDGSLRDHHLLESVRGDLLERVGRTEDARAAFTRAAALARNERERELLLERAGRWGGPPGPVGGSVDVGRHDHRPELE